MKSTKGYFLILPILLFLSYANTASGLNIPHTVAGSVIYSDTTIPADNDIEFEAYISTRPSEILTHGSPGCGYSSGNYFIQVGNFSTGWNVGDILVISFNNTAGTEVKQIQFPLTSAGTDIQNVQLERSR